MENAQAVTLSQPAEVKKYGEEWDKMIDASVRLWKSNQFPQLGNEYGAWVLIQKGQEIGLRPVAAIQVMSFRQGRIITEAKLFLGLFQRGGGKIKIVERTTERATVTFMKEGMDPFTDTYTIDDARRANLSTKDNWKAYPAEMLYWRCIARGIRAYWPMDVIGLYAKEEFDEEDHLPARVETIELVRVDAPAPAPAPVPAKVIDVTPEPPAEPKPAPPASAPAPEPVSGVFPIVPKEEPKPEPAPEKPKAEKKATKEKKAPAIEEDVDKLKASVRAAINLLIDKYNRTDIPSKIQAAFAASGRNITMDEIPDGLNLEELIWIGKRLADTITQEQDKEKK